MVRVVVAAERVWALLEVSREAAERGRRAVMECSSPRLALEVVAEWGQEEVAESEGPAGCWPPVQPLQPQCHGERMGEMR